MARRYFNWKLAVVLLMALAVLTLTAVGLRFWHRTRRAERGLILGNQAYEQQNWQEAAHQLGRFLAVNPGTPDVLLKYAEAQLSIRPLSQGNIQQAINAYRRVLRVDRANSEAATRVVEVYLAVGQPGEAELIARRHLESTDDPALRRRLAMALIRQRRFEEAEAELRAIVEEHPDHVLAYEAVGYLSERLAGPLADDPQQWFDLAVENNPDSALACIVRADFYRRNGDIARALDDLEIAEQKDLSNWKVRLRLAEEFIDADLLDRAEAHLAAVRAISAEDVSVWQALARFALKSGSKEKMRQTAEQGLEELGTQRWDFMPAAAELYIRADALDQAEECIKELGEKEVAPAVTAFLDGLLARKRNQGYEAIRCWQRAIELGNESLQIHLAMAETLNALGDRQSAIRRLQGLLSDRPDLVEGHLALGKLCAQNGDWAEAAECARRALLMEPTNFDASLLNTQAELQLLSTSAVGNQQVRRERIRERVSRLAQSGDRPGPAKLQQYEFALYSEDFTRAEKLLTELKTASLLDPMRLGLAEAKLYAAQAQSDRAATKLQGLVKEYPRSADPALQLAALLMQQDRQGKAEQVLAAALELIDLPAAKRQFGLLLANLYSSRGADGKAYELLTKLDEQLKSDVLIKRRLLRCANVTKNDNLAGQLVEQIKALEGEDAWQWRYEQARLWFAAKNFEHRYPEIIALLRENLLANPDDQLSRTLLAATHEKAGQLTLAASTFREAVNRSPRDINIIVPAVATLYRAGEYAQADNILRRAAKEELYHPVLSRLQYESNLKRGRLDSAENLLKDLILQDPNNTTMNLSLALLQMRQGKYEESEATLAKLNRREPDSVPVAAARAELNIYRKDHKQALAVCDEMVEQLGTASAYILRAMTCAKLGQNKCAESDFDKTLSLEPENIQALVLRSDFYNSIGRPEQALRDINLALTLQPENLSIQKRAIALWTDSAATENQQKAAAILEQALKAHPDDVELRLYESLLLLRQGKTESAKQAGEILQQVVKEHPKTTQAWAILAELALGQGRVGEAVDLALHGLAHQPEDKELLLLKARAEATGSPAVALPTIETVHRLYPDDCTITGQLADIYTRAGKYELAIQVLQSKLVDCSPQDRGKLGTALAVALYKKGDRETALDRFDSLLQATPDDAEPLLKLVELLIEDARFDEIEKRISQWRQKHPKDADTLTDLAGKLAPINDENAREQAESLLDAALQSNPQHVEALHSKAILLQLSGKSGEAIKFYRRVLQVQPDNLVAMNNLAWLLCENERAYEEALELADRGIASNDSYADLLDTRGMAHYRLGNYDAAMKDFARCLDLQPERSSERPVVHFHLARALAKAGRTEEAIVRLHKALSPGSESYQLSAEDASEAAKLLKQLSKGADNGSLAESAK